MRIIYLFTLFFPLLTDAQDTLTLERLDYKLMTVENGVITPMGSKNSSEVAGVFMPCTTEGSIEFCGKKNFSIWVDGRLYQTVEKKGCIYSTPADLCALVDRDTVFISIVSRGNLNGISLRNISIQERSLTSVYPATRHQVQNFLLIGFIVSGFFLLLIQHNFPIYFSRLKSGIEQFEFRPWSWTFIANLLALIVLGTFLWCKYSDSFYSFEYVLLVFSLFWILKSIVYWLSGSIFNLSNLSKWQLNFLLIFWLRFVIIFFIWSIVSSVFFPEILNDTSFLKFLASAGLAGFVLYQVFKIRADILPSGLHRFLYLCITEILPATLIIHWFFK